MLSTGESTTGCGTRDEGFTSQQDVGAPGGPDHDDLLALWERARGVARVVCRYALGRLAQGQGRFYGADDFWQDLFLEFWALVRRWHSSTGASEEDLWEAWRRLLWFGGHRILRRAPQRLWERADLSLDVDLLGDGIGRGFRALWGEGTASAGAVPRARAGMGSPEAQSDWLARIDALETAMWALSPGERQVLYMCNWGGLTARDAAQRLGLDGPGRVEGLLRAARAALKVGHARGRTRGERRP